MPTEIEAKMRIDDPAPLAVLLLRLGAEDLGEVLEQNTFFDTPDRKLKAADQGLRNRIARDAASGRSTCIITHKGPALKGALKIREETEITVDDADAAGRLLEKLGYVKQLAFEKRRRSFQLEGCRVELDELPRLGHFIEIEGPDEASVMAVRERLGLQGSELIKTPYIAMVSDLIGVDNRGQLVF